MAHIGKELALGLIGGFSCFFSFYQVFFCLFAPDCLAEGVRDAIEKIAFLFEKRPLVQYRTLLQVIDLDGATSLAVNDDVACLPPLGWLERSRSVFLSIETYFGAGNLGVVPGL
jgi:hypothetical protein